MFGIGFGEFVLLALIILVLIGPNELPQVMKAAGKLFREFSKARQDMRNTINDDDSLRDLRDSLHDVKKSVRLNVDEIAENIRAKISDEDEKPK